MQDHINANDMDQNDQQESMGGGKYNHLSKSAYMRSTNPYSIDYQTEQVISTKINEIEERISRANEKRSFQYGQNLERLSSNQEKFHQININKLEIFEKKEYDILNKVILKHHNKGKKLKLREKEEKDKKIYIDE